MLRKQVIEDIYQIMGISDIMRGATDPNETLGAQQLKTQNGSTRIRDKQQELVRLARDLVEITLEIITEQFDPVTMIEMSQTQLPTQAMQQQAAQQVIGQLQQLQQQAMQMQQQPQQQLPPPGGGSGDTSSDPSATPPPAPGQDAQGQQQAQMQAQAQDLMRQLQKLREQPTIEQVLKFLKSNRAKSFVLDIETDSTILADEQAEKQAVTEFMGVLGGLLPQLSQMIAAEPQTADFCGQLLKFATKPFRAGRQLDGAIDELVEQMKAKGAQPQGNPSAPLIQIEQMKQQTAREKLKQDADLAQKEMDQKDRHKTWELNNAKEIERIKMGQQSQADQAKMAVQNQKRMESSEAHQMDMMGKQADIAIAREKAQMAAVQAQNAAQAKQADFANRSNERQMAHQQKMQQPIGGA